MKKRIAVFSNAWSEKSLSDALEGIKEAADENDFDVFVFISYAAPGNDPIEQREEKRIYDLPELDEFDGAIMFSAAMNFSDLVQNIWGRAKKANIPLVSVGEKLEDCPLVAVNNTDSMEQLVEHLVVEHDVREVDFIAGTIDHFDSNTRVDSTKKVLNAHGYELKENQIHYGDWSVRGAMKTISDIIKERNGKLPDAFICANDVLAMSVCVELEKNGFNVPEDVIVTGFDGSGDGQIYSPALCTVKRDDNLTGKVAFESLLEAIHGEKVEDKEIESKFIKNQSCGCKNEIVDSLRSFECKKLFYDKIRRLEFRWDNNWLSARILNNSGVEDIHKSLREQFLSNNMFDNGTIFIMEDKKAQRNFAGDEIEEYAAGYSDELHVMVAIDKYNVVPVENIQRRELIPGYKKRENESRMFIFVPVHFRSSVFGYAVVEDWLSGIADTRLNMFTESFNQTIEKLKQNLALEQLNGRLQDLYTRDALTGIYNRFGFISEGVRIFEECQQEKKEMMLMFTDVNKMKLINDYYGHLQGDEAIKTVATTIMDNIPEEWIAIRFGGDEFLIIGECNDEDKIEAIKDKIVSDIKQKGKAMNWPFYLSVSCGYLHFVPEEGRTLDSYIKEADEAMYKIKEHISSTDEELKEFIERCRK